MDEVSTINQILQNETLQDLSPQLRTAMFLGGMAFLSSMLVTMTAFTRIVIVLSFVRRALSANEIPPTQVIIGLSLFLTLLVMSPTIDAIETVALTPYLNETISGSQAIEKGSQEVKRFMLKQTRRDDLQLFFKMSGT